MDINDLRSAFTVVSFVLFLGIVWWAFGKHSRRNFDEAAKLPFADDETDEATLRLDREDQRKKS
ncbi:cbb3-type cytochrome oxidase subunit 3 [Azospira inquinata]|uniref:Cbb3-type cytochrome c oxidase subunit 3 n=1 Tax=Azospira inquinata TaxID=2785627 RepID=A0A975SL22_9RHOO|nr:cbb3-type cytochrome c oxidase subunit 3 [Azospira inquinata]QWT46361.1 cbb3-type cytochrome c oxidase subunit 3 [Azospira inquinata]QWT48313.1 cbb3-type cytochrome c oxidase subunit 3 [Azospira inquinata]